MASIFATLAFHWAGRNNRFPDQLERLGRVRTASRSYITLLLTSFFPGDSRSRWPPITTVIEVGDYLETKIEAFRAHASQQPLWSLFEEYARRRGRREIFHLVAVINVEETSGLETDLFAGVSEEKS